MVRIFRSVKIAADCHTVFAAFFRKIPHVLHNAAIPRKFADETHADHAAAIRDFFNLRIGEIAFVRAQGAHKRVGGAHRRFALARQSENIARGAVGSVRYIGNRSPFQRVRHSGFAFCGESARRAVGRGKAVFCIPHGRKNFYAAIEQFFQR